MPKNILIVLGGGRPRGNTAQAVEAFARGARDAGHSVETISLVKNEVRGCLGCNACRYGKPCVQRDAFNDLAPKIKAADCIVFRDRGMLLCGGCGDTGGATQIDKTGHLERAYGFGLRLYEN